MHGRGRPGQPGTALRMLALDIGSSSVKAAVLQDGSVVAGPSRAAYETSYQGVRAEIEPAGLWRAVVAAVRALDGRDRIDLVGLTSLGPAWIAMDADGEPLTPFVTHADRRSIEQARAIERTVGRDRHLAVAGNRPFPGGIASTTWRWFAENEPDVLARADLVGPVTTWLHRRLTGERVIDPSQASFLGLFRTVTLDGWDPDLTAAAKADPRQLPEIHDADQVAGRVRGDPGLGLPAGTPVLAGCLDGSAAMLAAGAAAGGIATGLLVNAVGTTDVLAMAVDRPQPAPRLLTRALGVGRRWVCVATLASAGSTIEWAHRTLFPELSTEAYRKIIARFGAEPDPRGVRFRPFLAGDRTTLNQPRGGFSGMTLGTTREHLLSAVLDGLARESAARVPRLAAVAEPQRTVYVTGGAAVDVLYRDWPGEWDRRPLHEATLSGVAQLSRRVG
jgi:sugar (pentulose or hexulose) kinase